MGLRELAEKPIFKYLLKAGLHPDILAGLKQGYVQVPDDWVRSGFERILGSEPGISLNKCTCDTDGVHVELLVVHRRARLKLPLRLIISDIAIDSRQQVLTLNWEHQKAIGENFWGKVLSFAANGAIKRRIDESLTSADLVTRFDVGRNGRWCVLDLSGIRQLQPLRKKVPLVHLCALDLFSISTVEHIGGGIKFKLSVPLQ
jgi:hypothetical protein